MRRVAIVAAAGAIALAPLLVTTAAAHADQCADATAKGLPDASKICQTAPGGGGSPNNGQAYVPGKAGNGAQPQAPASPTTPAGIPDYGNGFDYANPGEPPPGVTPFPNPTPVTVVNPPQQQQIPYEDTGQGQSGNAGQTTGTDQNHCLFAKYLCTNGAAPDTVPPR